MTRRAFFMVETFQPVSASLASLLQHETSASYAAQSVRCSSMHTTTSFSECFFLESIFVLKSSTDRVSAIFSQFQPVSASLASLLPHDTSASHAAQSVR